MGNKYNIRYEETRRASPKYKEYQKKYRTTNKDKIGIQRKGYYLSTKGKSKRIKYRKDNKKIIAEKAKKYRPKNLKRTKEYSKKLKKAIFDFYGPICVCCKETNIFFLQIDHVNNDGSEDRKLGRATLYRRIIKEEFPDKYQILCANCNFGKRMNNGVCPHNNA